nr:MAG TPA: Adenylsuccinate lyase-like protein [Bacteriophage sp.]
MIERYEDKRIKEAWSNNKKYTVWYKIEKKLADAVARSHSRKLAEWKKIEFDASDEAEINRIEQDTKHDVAAFVKYICDENPKNAWAVHVGLTSSDLVDSALSNSIKESTYVLIYMLVALENKLSNIASNNKDSVMLGRTHGQQAVIMTLRHKLTVHMNQLSLIIRKLRYYVNRLSFKTDGPVGMGTYLNRDTFDYQLLGGALDLEGSQYRYECTQVIPRSYYFDIISTVFCLSQILTSIATDIRLLSQPEIGEFVLVNSKEQWGSSSMPHKVNPIKAERVCGLARLIQGYFNAFCGGMVLWNERDISNSCVEREALPSMFHAVVQQIKDLDDTLDIGTFNTEKMRNNILSCNISVMSYYMVIMLCTRDIVPYDEAVGYVKRLLKGPVGSLTVKDVLCGKDFDDSWLWEALRELLRTTLKIA